MSEWIENSLACVNEFWQVEERDILMRAEVYERGKCAGGIEKMI